MKKFSIIFYFLVLGYSLSAQTYLAINGNIFIPDQRVEMNYFSTSSTSLIGICLINSDKEILDQEYLAVQNNSAKFVYSIPKDLKNDIHYLLVYDDFGYYIHPISIGKPSASLLVSDFIPISGKFELNNVQPQNGDSLSMQVLLPQATKGVFVNVIAANHQIQYRKFTEYNTDYGGLTIELQNSDLDGDLAFNYFNNDKLTEIFFTKIRRGKAKIEIELIDNVSEYLLLSSNVGLSNAIWVDDISKVINDIGLPEFTTSMTNGDIDMYLKDIALRKRIYDDFAENVENTIDTIKQLDYPNDYSVNLDDYYPFKTMEDVVKEVLPWVKVKSDRNSQSQLVLMTNSYNKKIDRTPMTLYNYETLCIVDNVVIFDHQRVLDIDPSLINDINVYLNKVIVGDRFFNGIVNLTSKKSSNLQSQLSIKMNTPTVNRTSPTQQNEVNFNSPIFSTAEEMDNDVLRKSFVHSSERGEFKVEVLAISEDGSFKRFVGSYNVK